MREYPFTNVTRISSISYPPQMWEGTSTRVTRVECVRKYVGRSRLLRAVRQRGLP